MSEKDESVLNYISLQNTFFEKNIEIFEKSDLELFHYFFDTVAELIGKFKSEVNDYRLKFLVPQGSNFAFTVNAGNTVLLGIKRNIEDELVISLLLPLKRAVSEFNAVFDFDGFEEKTGTQKEYILTSFLFQKFRMEKYPEIKEVWLNTVQEIIDKKPRNKKADINNEFFFQVCTNSDVRKQAVEKIPEYLTPRFKNLSEEDEEDFQDYEFEPDQINISIEQKSLDSVLFRLEANPMKIDMNPMFQRNRGIWNNDNMSRFIESILLGLPIPAFFFDATENSRWIVVDGLQRLYSLYKFAVVKGKDSLVLSNLKILKKLNKKNYDSIPGEMKLRLKEYQVTLNLIKPITPPKVKYSIFHRINTGGYKLNNQEVRHALNLWYKGEEAKGTLLLSDLSKLSIFRKLVNVSSKRMNDKEIVLRFIAFQILGPEKYKSSMRIFLDDAIEELNRLIKAGGDSFIQEITSKFSNTLTRANELLGENPFNRILENEYEKKFNRSLFDAWMFHLAGLSDQQWSILSANKNSLIDDYRKVFQDDSDFDSSITSSTTSAYNIGVRFKTVKKIMQNYISDFEVRWI